MKQRFAFHAVTCDDGTILSPALVELEDGYVVACQPFTAEPAMTIWVGGDALIHNHRLRFKPHKNETHF